MEVYRLTFRFKLDLGQLLTCGKKDKLQKVLTLHMIDDEDV